MPNASSDVDPARTPTVADVPSPPPRARAVAQHPAPVVAEQGGPSGPEPTRFGDWERNGRCIDF